MSKKRGQRYNAIQHGVYSNPGSVELLLFGEKEEDFEALHQRCIAELQPNGVLEEETVYAIATYQFRKRRVDRLFGEQMDLLRASAKFRQIESALAVCELIKETKSPFFARQYLAFLPDHLLDPIKELFLQPERTQDEQWVSDLTEYMEKQMLILDGYIVKLENMPHFKAEFANKAQEALMKQAALHERLDLMIDKALKRLASLKVLKRFDLARSGSSLKVRAQISKRQKRSDADD